MTLLVWFAQVYAAEEAAEEGGDDDDDEDEEDGDDIESAKGFSFIRLPKARLLAPKRATERRAARRRCKQADMTPVAQVISHHDANLRHFTEHTHLTARPEHAQSDGAASSPEEGAGKARPWAEVGFFRWFCSWAGFCLFVQKCFLRSENPATLNTR